MRRHRRAGAKPVKRVLIPAADGFVPPPPRAPARAREPWKTATCGSPVLEAAVACELVPAADALVPERPSGW